MSDKVLTELIEDIFNIPRDGKNISDDDADDLGLSGTKSSVSFDTLAKEVAASVDEGNTASKTEEKVEKIEEKIEEKTKELQVVKSNNDVDTALRNSVPESIKMAEITPTVSEKVTMAATPSSQLPSPELFGDDDAEQPAISPSKPIVGQKVEKPVADVIKTEMVTPTKLLPDNPDEIDEEIANDDTKSVGFSDGGERWVAGENWLTVSPSAKYDVLYREKRIALTDGPNGILKGGQIDFDKYFDELAQLNVDVIVKTYNSKDIHDKMQQVQQMRTRLEYIRLKVTKQYYLWDRYIEMFRGILSRIEYIRCKQEGVYYEHLRDMEHYAASLKGLYKNTEGVMKNLDGIFECLSRQVTIVLPMKSIDRSDGGGYTELGIASSPKPMTSDLKSFDSLDSKGKETNVPKGWKL